MNASQKTTATQSQKLMIFVLTMSLYGLATLFTVVSYTHLDVYKRQPLAHVRAGHY